mmetsp:Transcript_9462/g.8331  ORF Transcript_9462/g.8331 Transcript_9462/m.8331 type:complete len:122 (+) Transcript_9462:210-575(+)
MISILEGFSEAMKMSRHIEGNGINRVQATPFDEEGDYLEVVQSPYLASLNGYLKDKPYTLVLDLDETLVHYFEIGDQGKFMVRPGVSNFLKEMNKYYEIIIFTAAIQDYADWAINQIDPDG